ncbi:C1 family peptidase [Sedimenticola selenatireducens]|uniref:Peptidase C1 n=1 Tax=Sedimenticola selenatireducens TaxID=191960 RepID=A0A557SEU4_9GAMM|nr:C1 family peptidase [Sedimenticola selenatireducens]TVO75903.1 peptidase C1 [Sedimenticola selenatireducens]TVT63762.1 MAG: peptidase C1 [Sedimenticola selenatireducens]
MAKNKTAMLDGYPLTATADLPDNRDWEYQPPPMSLKRYLNKPRTLMPLDQKSEGACTGFGLAAVINLLNQARGSKVKVSARMLYEMARKHDEWPGEDYAGSSCRGAIKGFSNMGVCRDSFWPYRDGKPGELTVRAAKDARSNTIGAYYRLNHRISDFHAAINEAGAIFCSANVHEGWASSAIKRDVIPLSDEITGGHAFALVGYNSKGFWVQNSWGKGWGQGGTALWTYEDWYENLVDAWVLSLALPTPQIWHLGSAQAGFARDGSAVARSSPPRGKIAGHFVHIDDGKFHDAGSYWSNLDDVKATAARLKESTKYDHLLIYAHGGLNSPKDSAKRIAAMRDVFKANRIYPYHVMYDTGILEELLDVIRSRGDRTGDRVGGMSDWWDRLLERLARRPGRALWREMKFGASAGFEQNRAGVQTLKAFTDALGQGSGLRFKLHLVGHSTGAVLLAHLLSAIQTLAPKLRISSCSLLAPAATVDLFDSHYKPIIATPSTQFGINEMTIYNLSEQLELDDAVGPYRKSLLYFVSRSFEEDTPAPILGMQLYSKKLDNKLTGLELVYSQGDVVREPRSLSKVHGGFDNDPATLNDLLKRVLGKKPTRLFTSSDLEY